MSNLKKPIFWAYVSLFGYISTIVIIRAFTRESPNPTQLILLALLCIVFAVLIVFFLRRPIEGSPFEALEPLFSCSLILIGIFLMYLGAVGLLDRLTFPPTAHENLSSFGINLTVILMLPFGFLILFFSLSSLISSLGRKKTAKAKGS